MDLYDKKIICTLRNRLQAPKITLERLSKNKGTPKSFCIEALDDLEKAIDILKELTKK